MNYCLYCGTELYVTNWGREHCPNCGIIDEEEKSESGDNPSYIG